MEILIFVVVIVVLIVVHEFGHFLAAKLSGMRVDEFGLGFPPRAMVIAKKGRDTLHAQLVALRRLREDLWRGRESPECRARPARILFKTAPCAGVGAYRRHRDESLFCVSMYYRRAHHGDAPRALARRTRECSRYEAYGGERAPRDPRRPHRAPAGRLNYQCERCRGGDGKQLILKSFSEFIARSGGGPVELRVKSGKDEKTITATPRAAVASADPSRYVLGIEVVTVGVVPLSFGTAMIEGAQITWGATKLTAVGLWHFFYGIFTFSADLSQIAGPVGIAGVVGSASAQGLGYLFSIMAIISINLALINLIPVPALDGGRLLFVLIESIIRRPIKASVAHAMNAIGFVFLILLMLVVTVSDIFKIVS